MLREADPLRPQQQGSAGDGWNLPIMIRTQWPRLGGQEAAAQAVDNGSANSAEEQKVESDEQKLAVDTGSGWSSPLMHRARWLCLGAGSAAAADVAEGF